MSDNILVERNGFVGIIINRPEKLNAMTPAMADALAAAVEGFNTDDTIRCVISTGAGEKAFCAGSDISTLDSYETPWAFRNRPDYCDALRALLKPSIAAVNGYAFGGGLETAMTCDIRIASDNASFAAPEVKLGWIGGGGMAVNLAHAVGPSNAALMIMTGDAIDAATAERWGPGLPGVTARLPHGGSKGCSHHHRVARAYCSRNGETQFAGGVGNEHRRCHLV